MAETDEQRTRPYNADVSGTEVEISPAYDDEGNPIPEEDRHPVKIGGQDVENIDGPSDDLKAAMGDVETVSATSASRSPLTEGSSLSVNARSPLVTDQSEVPVTASSRSPVQDVLVSAEEEDKEAAKLIVNDEKPESGGGPPLTEGDEAQPESASVDETLSEATYSGVDDSADPASSDPVPVDSGAESSDESDKDSTS